MSRVTCPVSPLTWTQCALVSTCWLLTSVPPHTSSTVPPPSAPTAATQGWLPRTLVCPTTSHGPGPALYIAYSEAQLSGLKFSRRVFGDNAFIKP